MIGHSGACLEAAQRASARAVRTAIGQGIKAPTMAPSRVRRIFEVIYTVTGFSRADLQSNRRARALVHARWLFILASLRLGVPPSYSEIARHLHKDHSTIMWGAAVAQAYLTTDNARGAEVARRWAAFQHVWVARL